jgi:hypothetical protein
LLFSHEAVNAPEALLSFNKLISWQLLDAAACIVHLNRCKVRGGTQSVAASNKFESCYNPQSRNKETQESTMKGNESTDPKATTSTRKDAEEKVTANRQAPQPHQTIKGGVTAQFNIDRSATLASNSAQERCT